MPEPLDPPIWGVARWGHFMWQPSPTPQPPVPIPSHFKRKQRKPMNDPLQNRLNMIGACLTFANAAGNLAAWQNQPPLDLTADMATLGTLYTAASETGSQLAGATTGVAEGKDAAETVLEDRGYLLARAIFNHCRKTGDAENCGRVNLTKSAIQRLRDQDLLATSRDIRDIAQAKSAEPGAAGRGITAAAITALTGAIDAYALVVNAPRTRIASRTALNRELATRVAACMDHIENVDDLVIQLTGPGAADFIAGWQQNRIIVDAGHGPGEEEPPPPAPAPPTP